MSTFEDVGRKLDREIEKLRELAEQKIKPETRARAARSLRSISDALQRYAEQLESRNEPPAAEEPPGAPPSGETKAPEAKEG